MFDITQLGKFNLAKGCHEEINANGDLCVNEAAILAAGFEHRAVKSVDDCPPCFSRVIAQYAIELNDRMPDDLRKELLAPFIMRFPGTADNNGVELKRLGFIVLEHVRRINSYVCRTIMRDAAIAAECERVSLLQQALRLTRQIRRQYRHRCRIDAAPSAATTANAVYLTWALHVQMAYDGSNLLSDAFVADASAVSRLCAGTCGFAYAAAALAGTNAQRRVFTMATDILDDAIKIGNHSERLTIRDLAPYPGGRGASPAAITSSRRLV